MKHTNGVVVDIVAGITTITVVEGAPDLYYYCEFHAGMGADVTTE